MTHADASIAHCRHQASTKHRVRPAAAAVPRPLPAPRPAPHGQRRDAYAYVYRHTRLYAAVAIHTMIINDTDADTCAGTYAQ